MHVKAAGFTLVAVATLALALGVSTAVFSVVNAVMLRPLPYPDSERIVIPWRLAPPELNLGYNEIPWGLSEFRLMQGLKTFQSLGAFKSGTFNLTGTGEPALLEGLRASAGFLSSLGVAPILGRNFTVDEDQPGHEHEVVLSHQLWQERFGGDPTVLGRAVNLNGTPYTVIGVMPLGFAFPRGEEMPGSFGFPREAQLWVPLALPAAPRPNEPDELAVIGRLKPGTTVAQAQEEMNVLSARLGSESPESKGWFNSRLTPLVRQVVGDTRSPLLLMLGAVGVVLLIAFSNVANLLLARSLGRRTEFTLRAALGARRSRLMRQFFTENLLLAAAAGLVGILIAEAGIHFLRVFGPSNIPRLREVGLDLRVFAFLLSITFLGGILFGLAPAIAATRENLAEPLKEGGQRSGGRAGAPRVRNVLLISEVALALVLVIASGLLVRTFLRLLSVDPGFNASSVLTFELSLPSSKYTKAERIVTLYHTALQQFQSIPGVQSAGVVETVPLDGATEGSAIRFPDRAAAKAKENPFANYNIASPGYFSAVGTPVLRGRDFLETDTEGSTPVALINNAMAKKFWPNEDPIGRQVGLANPQFPAMSIAGIVADVKHLSLRDDPGPEMYVPYTQKPYPSMLTMHVVLRTKSDPAWVAQSLREAARLVDPDLPIAKLTALTTLVDNSVAGSRFSMLLLVAFGALALFLATIGMYSLISYSVTQRTREIGIRMALGAQRRSVFGMILGQGARLAAIGLLIGLLTALGVTRMMRSALYGVGATDALTFTAVSLLLVAVALFACYMPARRATRVDPIIALRYE
jgi:putative ABC transport system permease protein